MEAILAQKPGIAELYSALPQPEQNALEAIPDNSRQFQIYPN
jgi:hypothetical protein